MFFRTVCLTSLAMFAAAAAEISGVVQDSNHQPIVGARVSLSGAASLEIYTGSNGAYSFSGLGQGSYAVTPYVPHYSCAPTNYVQSVAASSQVTQNFACTVVADGSVISGAVVNSSNMPVAGVHMTLTGTCSQTVDTDAAGRYSFSALPPGNYSVGASLGGYSCAPPSHSYSPLTNDRPNENFVCSPTSGGAGSLSITGVVKDASDQPLAGATVTLSGAASESVSTAADGFYRFTALASANYTVAASAAGLGCVPAAHSYSPLVANRDAQNFTCSAPPSPSGYSISGRVTDTNGAPLPNINISLAGPQVGTTRTGADGLYWFTGRPQGDYTVAPAQAGYTCAPINRTLAGLTSNQTNVDFICSASGQPAGYTVSGAVYDLQGAPLEGFTARITGRRTEAVTTTASGSFAFSGLLTGDYSLTAQKNGFTCEPSQKTFLQLATDYTGQNFTCRSADIPGPAPDRIFTISGIIYNGAMLPLPGMRVALAGPLSTTVTSGADGSYSFTGLVSADYIVIPGALGYSCQQPSRFYASLNGNQTKQNFQCVQTGTYPGSSYGISGRVQDNTGAALAGAVVTLGGAYYATVTTADGSYAFTGLPQGDYTVAAGKYNYTCSPSGRSYPNFHSVATGQNFVCAPTAPAFVNSYNLSGRVYDTANRPLPWVTVMLSGSMWQAAVTAADGAYSLLSIPSGTYGLAVVNDGYTCAPATLDVVLSSDQTGVDFHCSVAAAASGFSISGKVNDLAGRPMSGATVTLAGGANSTVTTSATGAYSFTGLVKANYSVTASRSGHVCQPPNRRFEQLGSSQTGQDFTCSLAPPGYTISGVVYDANNQPLEGVSVRLNDTTSKATTADGTFAFTSLAAGSYTVAASKSVYICLPSVLSFANLAADQTGKIFTCTASAPGAGFTISGYVSDGATALANINVTLTTGNSTITAPTTAQGYYAFSGLAQGDYTVAVTHSGYSCQPSSRPYTNLSSDRTNQNFACTATITSGSNCALTRYSISGTVRDAGQAVIAGVRITVSGLQSFDTYTGENGTYCVTGLPQGSTVATTAFKTGYSCDPAAKSYLALSADQINQDFTCAVTPAAAPLAIGACPANPAGRVAVEYFGAAPAVSGGRTPYTYSAVGLPGGLVMTEDTGAITGIPTTAATFNYTVTVGDASTPAASVSRSCSLTVKPASSGGAGWTTYTQGGWGSAPNGNNPGALLAQNFSTVYPSGVWIGDPNGRNLKFTSAAAIEAFLPQGGAAEALPASAENPTGSISVFAGQVLALQLNADFSNAGVTPNGLAAKTVVSGPLAGQTVAQVLAIAHAVLGGGALPSGLSLATLNGIVDDINNNYDNGTSNDGFLQ